MLAAAEGRRRTDPVEDLIMLRFGVRIDQPGAVTRDFHTARTLDGKKSMPLSNRYYLSDAVFLAGIEGHRDVLERLDFALRHPRFPLYLGRRSCPPTLPVSLGLREGELLEVLRTEPWHASETYLRRTSESDVEILVDKKAVPEGESTDYAFGSRDVPFSFDPRRREYGFRDVERSKVHLRVVLPDQHDPMDAAQQAQEA
ncbi:type I-E CRISPR-associated protein Cas5/CasD [Actinobaculum sp. 313]|uniref:type I-E CRISPR-associated protein Cas5/CasD n=1 Tax=Actinobaculum sp. 313 TaxID=2495645 RepID=UPI001F0BD0C9|nr:type I-E CRISPR-associated protein Cas5/CasD [Actinobaculum sp. 313]